MAGVGCGDGRAHIQPPGEWGGETLTSLWKCWPCFQSLQWFTRNLDFHVKSFSGCLLILLKNMKTKVTRANNPHQPAGMAPRVPAFSPFAQSGKHSGSPAPGGTLLVTNGSEDQRDFHASSCFSQWSRGSLSPRESVVKAFLKHKPLPRGLGAQGFWLHQWGEVHLLLLDFFIHLQKLATQPMWQTRQSQLWLQDLGYTHCHLPRSTLIFCSEDKSDFAKLNFPTATLLHYLRGWRD